MADKAFESCLVVGAMCPVVACCTPCLCCAVNVVACSDEKNNIFKHVDQSLPVTIDNAEVELLDRRQWTCTCGHVYNAMLDGKGKEFRDLPLEWPCPECGQVYLNAWTSSKTGDCLSARNSNVSLRSDSSTPPAHPIPIVSHSMFNTLTTGCSSTASSVAICSGTFSTSCHSRSSSISWEDEYDWETASSTNSQDEFARFRSSLEPQDLPSVLADCCCEFGHALTWKDESLWCQICASAIPWPTWPQITHQERARVTHTPNVPSDDRALLRGNGRTIHRKGIGSELSPIRPGFRAGGGIAGPWWTRTDPRIAGY